MKRWRRSSGTGRSSNIACRSTCSGCGTNSTASTGRRFGRPNATARFGRNCKADLAMTAGRVHKRYAYRRPTELDAGGPRRVPVIVVGAGPVGLTVALDLARRGQHVIVLNLEDTVGEGSKAI